MSVYGFFQPSVLGMESQSHALEAIATNITNIRTGGYRRTDVEFATVLSETFSSQPGNGNAPSGTNHADFGGVRPIDRHRIGLQGLIVTTHRELDVALNGRGFFTLNTETDGSGQELYGRDGRFSIIAQSSQDAGAAGGYLVDKNGYYVMGYEVGSGSVASDPEPIDLEPHLTIAGQPTSAASLALNLPASDDPATSRSHAIDVHDSNGNLRSLYLQFAKSNTPNVWSFDVTSAAGDLVDLQSASPTVSVTTDADQRSIFDSLTNSVEIRSLLTDLPIPGVFEGFGVGDEFSISGAGGSDGTYTVAGIAPDASSLTLDPLTPLLADDQVDVPVTFSVVDPALEQLRFNAGGTLDSPDGFQIDVQHADGAASSFVLDVSRFTQYGGPLLQVTYEHDGFPPGELEKLEFDSKGQLIGRYDNSHNSVLYSLTIADFINPDGLVARSGNVYELGETSGETQYGTAGEGKFGAILPTSHELSNVTLEQEFTRMSMTQSAYNASATTFRTADEMTEVARDLKA